MRNVSSPSLLTEIQQLTTALVLLAGVGGCSLKPPNHEVKFVIDTAALQKAFEQGKLSQPVSEEGALPSISNEEFLNFSLPKFAAPTRFFASKDALGKFTNGFSCLAVNVTGSAIPQRATPNGLIFHPKYTPKILSSLIQVLPIREGMTTIETQLKLPVVGDVLIQIWGLQTDTGQCPSPDGSRDVNTEVYSLAQMPFNIKPGENTAVLTPPSALSTLVAPDNRVFIDQPKPLFFFSISSGNAMDSPVLTALTLPASGTSTVYLHNLVPDRVSVTSVSITSGGSSQSWLNCTGTPAASAATCTLNADSTLQSSVTLTASLSFTDSGGLSQTRSFTIPISASSPIPISSSTPTPVNFQYAIIKNNIPDPSTSGITFFQRIPSSASAVMPLIPANGPTGASTYSLQSVVKRTNQSQQILCSPESTACTSGNQFITFDPPTGRVNFPVSTSSAVADYVVTIVAKSSSGTDLGWTTLTLKIVSGTPPAPATALVWDGTGYRAMWTAPNPALADTDTQILRLFSGGGCGGSQISESITLASSSISYSFTTLSPGTYSYQIDTKNVWGDLSTSSCSSSLTVPSGSVAITSPRNGFITKESTVSVSGTCSGNESVSLTASQNLDSSAVVTAACSSGSFNASVTISGFEGTIILSATQGSNKSEIAISRDTTPPNLTITVPTPDSTITALPVTISGSCEPGPNPVQITINANGTALPTLNGVPCSSAGTFSTALTSLNTFTSGTVTVSAQQTDAAGNTGSRTATYNVSLSQPALAFQIQGSSETQGLSFATWTGTAMTIEPIAAYSSGFTFYAANTPSCIAPDSSFSSNGKFTISGQSPCTAGGATITITATPKMGSAQSAILTVDNNTAAPSFSMCTLACRAWRGLPMGRLEGKFISVTIGAAWSAQSEPGQDNDVLIPTPASGSFGWPEVIQTESKSFSFAGLTLSPGARMKVSSALSNSTAPALTVTSIFLNSSTPDVALTSRLYLNAKTRTTGFVEVADRSVLQVDGELQILDQIRSLGTANKNSGIRGSGTLLLGDGTSRTQLVQGNLAAHVIVSQSTTVSLTSTTWIQFLPNNSAGSLATDPQLKVEGTLIIPSTPTLTVPGKVTITSTGKINLNSSSNIQLLLLQNFKRDTLFGVFNPALLNFMGALTGNDYTWFHYSDWTSNNQLPAPIIPNSPFERACTASGGSYMSAGSASTCTGPLSQDISYCTQAGRNWIGDDFEGYCPTGSP